MGSSSSLQALLLAFTLFVQAQYIPIPDTEGSVLDLCDGEVNVDVDSTAQALTITNCLEELPTQFGRLTKLTYLDLQDNGIPELPTQFGQLTKLIYLDLNRNGLHHLPTEFGRLQQLTYLDVRENGFQQLPTEIGHSTQLDELLLYNNVLEYVPTEIGRLQQLTTLDLGWNRLVELPTEIGHLTRVKSLDLCDNSLEELPTELGRVGLLEELDLRDNDLVELPTEFGHLVRLTALELLHNGLATLPSEFGRIVKLARLNFDGNSLVELPTVFGRLKQLTYLDFKQNKLVNLPTEFGNLVELTELHVLDNRLVQLPTEFGRLRQLIDLTLKGNDLWKLPTEFGYVDKLTNLDLSANNVEQLPTEIGKLERLTHIECGTNSLITLPTELGKLVELTRLGFKENSIMVLPTEVGQLVQVDSLDLEANPLWMVPSELGRVTKLQYLNTRGSSFIHFSTEFGELTRLTYLNLAGQTLQALPPEIGRLVQLTYLNLQGFRLPDIPTEFGNLQNLTHADLRGNTLKELPSEFGHLTRLTYLGLQRNTIAKLPFPPTDLAVDMVRSSSVDLSWSPPTVPLLATGYEAEIDSAGTTRTFSSPSNQIGINLLRMFRDIGIAQQTLSIKVKAHFEGEFTSYWSKPLEVTTCPASMQRENTNDIDKCYALAGFYRTRAGFARSCKNLESDLPSGAIGQCLQARLDVESLPISSQFWRASLSTEDIRLCPDVQFCSPRVSNMSFASPDRYCAPHHTGTYCSDCEEEYVLGAEGCTFCAKEVRDGEPVLLVCTFLLLLIALYVYVLFSAGCFKKIRCCKRSERRPTRQGSRWKFCKKLDMQIILWTKLRIVLGYFQVLSSYRRTFLKQALTNSADLLGVMALLSNVDLTWLMDNEAFRCVYDYNHYDVLLIATLGPILLGVFLFLCTGITTYCIVPRLMRTIRHHTESALLLMLFLIYPYVSQTVLGTLWCESFPNADRTFNLTTSALRADYRLSCEREMDPKRRGFEVYAGVMIIVYPVGIVALYVCVLHLYRDRIMASTNMDTKNNKDNLTKVLFLIKPYKVERFWFEAYELVRKLIQTSFVGFLAGLTVQEEFPGFLALISEVLTIIFVLGLYSLQPYTHSSDFAFALISLLLLLPASQYSMLDPYARHEGIRNYGLEALVITELGVFGFFVAFEIGRTLLVKDCSCGARCLERDVRADDTPWYDDRDVDQMVPLVAMKKKIVELESSLAFFKAETARLGGREHPAHGSLDAEETSVQRA